MIPQPPSDSLHADLCDGTAITDFHTHNLQAPAGRAIINLPQAWTECPAQFHPRPGALYSAGIHPWWTADHEAILRMKQALPRLLSHPQVVALGECGIDRLRGASLAEQEELLRWQLALGETLHLPVTLHVVRAFDILLHLHKELRPTTRWTIHGFRGGPALARQLLAAGLDLSFGVRYNPEAFDLTPPEKRHRETDDGRQTTEAVFQDK